MSRRGERAGRSAQREGARPARAPTPAELEHAQLELDVAHVVPLTEAQKQALVGARVEWYAGAPPCAKGDAS